jgi:hypothetical protein
MGQRANRARMVRGLISVKMDNRNQSCEKDQEDTQRGNGTVCACPVP